MDIDFLGLEIKDIACCLLSTKPFEDCEDGYETWLNSAITFKGVLLEKFPYRKKAIDFIFEDIVGI